jgi:quercetin dioxygenase-like cupin family protein
MTRSRTVAAGTAVIAFLVIGAKNVLPSTAQEPPPPPPIAAEFLTGRAAFTDDLAIKFRIRLAGGATTVVKSDDPSRTVVARYTVQPGAQFPWHTHSGPVIVNVVSGELVYVGAEDCVRHAYGAGTAFVDAGHGHVHTAYNPTQAPTVLVATFFEAPAEGPLLIPAQAPEGCSI